MTHGIVRHGIVGCGRVAPNHVIGANLSAISEVAWACDRDPAVLAEFARQHGIARQTTDYHEMLADPELTSVSIVVDHAQHAMIARAALLAGKHVLVEKPLALSVKEARDLVDLAEKRGLLLATVSQHRFDPLFIEIAKLLSEGALGGLVAIWVTLVCGREPAYYSDSYWRGTWAREGGSLLINQAYHCVDLMVALGGRPRVLGCETRILKLGDVLETEDVATATFLFPNGALGTLACTSATPEFWRSRLDVIGTKGSITFDIDHPNRLHGHCLPAEVDSSRMIAASNLQVEVPPGVDYYGVSHNRQIADFLEAIRDKRSLKTPARAGLTTLEVILDAYALARERREVPAMREMSV